MEHDREEGNQRNLNYLGDDEVPVDELVLDGLVVVEEELEDVLDDRGLDEEELFFLQKRSDVASPVAVKHATS